MHVSDTGSTIMPMKLLVWKCEQVASKTYAYIRDNIKIGPKETGCVIVKNI